METEQQQQLIARYSGDQKDEPKISAADPLGSIFEIVLLTPDLAQVCRFGRDDPGLKLFQDGIYVGDVASLSQACRLIQERTGRYVTLTENRHGDLYRWTVAPMSVPKC